MIKRKILVLTSMFALLLTCNYSVALGKDKDFKSFLENFTNSASFQYSRVKFPLESSIVLLDEGGNEKKFPFTREKWPLLESEMFKEEKIEQEEGGSYIAKFVLNELKRKEFESGYEESELDLRVVFELIDGEWFVTDCYNAWYSFDLPAEEFDDTIRQVQEHNDFFTEQYP